MSASEVGNIAPLSLHPATNARQAWAALLLGLPAAPDLNDLVRLFDEFGFGAALGELSCIVPLDHPASLPDALAERLPSARLVLRMPLAACLEADAATDLARLQRHGFRLMATGMPAAGQKLPEALTALAVDAATIPADDLPKILRQLPGPHLAMGMDTPAGFALALAAGCSLFAGDYPLHPLPAQQQQGPSRALLLKLLGLVTRDAESHAIEALLKQAPDLSYQLLKLVNSVSFSLANKISNFGHAIAVLGRRQLQRWLQLLLYVQNRGNGHNPLMERAALRASLAEALSKASGGDREEQERAFMAGMFSLLDALFSMPLADIVTPLNLADEVVDALLRRAGRLGALLAIAEQSEQAAHVAAEEFGGQLAAAGLTPAAYCRCLVQACQWTIQLNRGI